MTKVLARYKYHTATISGPVFLTMNVMLIIRANLRLLGVLVQGIFRLNVSRLATNVPRKRRYTSTNRHNVSTFCRARLKVFTMMGSIVLCHVARVTRVKIHIGNTTFFFNVFLFIRRHMIHIRIERHYVRLLHRQTLLVQRANETRSMKTTSRLRFATSRFQIISRVLIRQSSIFYFSGICPQYILLRSSTTLLRGRGIKNRFHANVTLRHNIKRTCYTSRIAPHYRVLTRIL